MKAGLNLIPWVIRYKLHRTLGRPRAMPINVTISVTNACNSRCKTCFIWRLYHERPELKDREFGVDEFERVFESLGRQVVWVTLSGGEPYLRRDLPRICDALHECCEPTIVNIPTNGLLPLVIEAETKEILQRCPSTTVIVNLSLDGVGNEHDDVRGVPGSFEKFIETYSRLKRLKNEFMRLQVGVHTVISKYNIDAIPKIYEYVKQLNPDSYITEVAENRTELFNINEDVTPNADAYANAINELSCRIRDDFIHYKTDFRKIIQAFRLTYYQIAVRALREERQVIPCYAGYASCHITPYGDVWPCCVLGYNKPMGNLRETDYDFKRVWLSKEADDIREYIKGKNCACPLANAHYTNILCSFTSVIKVLKNCR